MNNGEIAIKKVKGEGNAADGDTKHVEKKQKMQDSVWKCGFRYVKGRHVLCPQLGD